MNFKDVCYFKYYQSNNGGTFPIYFAEFNFEDYSHVYDIIDEEIKPIMKEASENKVKGLSCTIYNLPTLQIERLIKEVVNWGFEITMRYDTNRTFEFEIRWV